MGDLGYFRERRWLTAGVSSSRGFAARLRANMAASQELIDAAYSLGLGNPGAGGVCGERTADAEARSTNASAGRRCAADVPVAAYISAGERDRECLAWTLCGAAKGLVAARHAVCGIVVVIGGSTVVRPGVRDGNRAWAESHMAQHAGAAGDGRRDAAAFYCGSAASGCW